MPLADFLDLVAPLSSGAALRARVETVRRETADAATLVLRPGRGWAGHRAGQWVRVGVDIDGVRHWRAYSLTEPARRDGRIAITPKVVPGGLVSTHLVRATRPGTLLHLEPAAGEFVLPRALPEKLLFVTAGSGITPVMGMLRARGADLPDVVLVHSAPTADAVVFGRELRFLARSGRIRLVERHTDTDGLLAPADLCALVPDWQERGTWACGPGAMLAGLQTHWDSAGLALHTEAFQPAVVADPGTGGQVSFGRAGVVSAAAPGESLLAAGERAGVLLPSGCRMGVCFGCVVPLTAGTVRDLRDGSTTTAVQGESVFVQTCVNAAAGDCAVSA